MFMIFISCLVLLIGLRLILGEAMKKDEQMGRGNDLRMKEKVRMIATVVLTSIMILIVGGSSFYTIAEQEAAVVTTFGVPEAVTETGLHFKIPFVQEVTKVGTTINGLQMGYRVTDTGTVSVDEESLMITSDYNFVNIDFYIEYRAVDPVKYLYASMDPTEVLKNISQSWIRDTIGSYGVDAVLTTGKSEIQATIKERIIAELDAMDIGIQLVNITIQDAEPPTDEVMVAFKMVETAKQGMETSINNAVKYENEQSPLAEAEIDRILQEAEAAKAERINEGNEEVAMFNAMYEEYARNPEVTRLRMFYEAMEDILPDMKIVINSADGQVQTVYPLEDFSSTTVYGNNGNTVNNGNSDNNVNNANNDTAGGAADEE